MFSHILDVLAFCWISVLAIAAPIEEVCGQDACEPELGRALLQVRHSGHKFDNRRTRGVGMTADLSEKGYQEVVKKCCTKEMVDFFKRVIAKQSRKECIVGGVPGVAVWHDCPDDNGSYEGLLAAIKKGEQGPCAWLSPSEDDCLNRSSDCPSFPDEPLEACSDDESSTIAGEDEDENADNGSSTIVSDGEEEKPDTSAAIDEAPDDIDEEKGVVTDGTDIRKCTSAEIAGNEYFAHEKSNSQTGHRYCYRLTVKGEIEQSAYNFSTSDCNHAGFKREFSVGVYKAQISDYEEHYADGDMMWCGEPGREVPRQGYLRVEQDPSAVENYVEVNEPSTCEYHLKLTIPSCSAPALPLPPIHPKKVPRDCKVTEISGKKFYIYQSKNEQTGDSYCYKMVVKGTIEQSHPNRPEKDCNEAGFSKMVAVGKYAKDISDVEELYDEGDYRWCGFVRKMVNGRSTVVRLKRKGYLIVQEDASATAVSLTTSERNKCEYHFIVTVPSCSA